MKPSRLEEIDPGALRPNPWNTNVVSPDNEAKLEESIKRLGMFKPVVVRTLDDGTLQIIGGEHRATVAKRMGLKKIPVVNLGTVDDKQAQEIALIDNSRYGSDDALQLASLLEGLGDPVELASFMPYSESDLTAIFSSVNIALEDLELTEEDEQRPNLPTEKPIQTHQMLRFKVPVEDAKDISDMIEKVMKVQKFTQSDSLTNAGDALVYLLKRAEE